MVHQIIRVFLIIFCLEANAQQFIAKEGVITFFSEAPIENIQAYNKKVGAVYNASTSELVFSVKIKDFIFKKKLMQAHFNENYLESDIYPKSTFIGNVIELKENGYAKVKGKLNIHGITNNIIAEGTLNINNSKAIIKAKFRLKLEDYNIEIPKIVIYNIAEVIDVDVEIQLDKYEG
tara:strand:+ start:894 stop:1424 length:531 start_codon:yes stop_codon:yes gene_type:complete